MFKNAIYNSVRTIIRAKRNWVEWMVRKRLDLDATSSFHHHYHPSSKPISLISWAKPPGGFIKINFDGSLINFSAAGWFIFQDWTSKPVKAWAIYYGQSSILVAEANRNGNGAGWGWWAYFASPSPLFSPSRSPLRGKFLHVAIPSRDFYP